MDIEEIRSSGILELYVIGELSPAQNAEVESYLTQYPDLKKDVYEIEKTLEAFAASSALKAPAGLKQKVMDSIHQNPKSIPVTKSGPGLWPLIASLFGLGALMLAFLVYQNDQKTEELEQQLTVLRDTCDATTSQLTGELNELKQLTLPGNKIIPFAATPGFAQTDIYLHHNTQTGKNFIQVSNLPVIADNQSYQLWALKPNQAPLPLDVFDLPQTGLIEVRFVEDTETYAITIEPEGGSQTPTLEHLIGTAGVN